MRLDERGKQCPLPVIDTKKALERCRPGEVAEVIVDNEIAVQNLRKMAGHKGMESAFEKVSDREFIVRIKKDDSAGEGAANQAGRNVPRATGQSTGSVSGKAAASVSAPGEDVGTAGLPEDPACLPDSRRRGMTVVLSSNVMGQGNEDLGKLLMKGFVYALTQQDVLPETVLLYNSGAFLSCEGSDNLEDLKALEALGAEILTCGTCLNHYGLGEKLRVGSVTNMYEIVERMTGAGLLVRP